MRKQCTEEVVRIASADIAEYDTLGPYLGLTHTEIHETKEDHKSCQQIKHHIMLKWIEKEESNATELALASALLKMKNNDAAELLIGKHSSINHTTHVHKHFPNCDKEEMESKMFQENDRVKQEYASVECKILDLLSKNPELTLLYIKKCIRKAGYVALYDKIKCESDISAVSLAIGNNSNWCNYELLEVVINGLGNDTDTCKAEFQAYKDECLYPYLERAIYKIPPESLGSDIQRDDQVLLHLMIYGNVKLNGQDLKVLHRKLIHHLQQPSLTLSTYREGGKEIVFSIDRYSLQSSAEQPPSPPIQWNNERKCYEVEITSLM